jgi:competence ComEA-like helix-hairpin-helix protein
LYEKDVITTEKTERGGEEMRRKLFFLLEKLQITRSERIAVSILMLSLVAISLIYAITEPKLNYDPEQYAEIEQIFFERSNRMEMEREKILARYRPGVAITARNHETEEVDRSELLPKSSERININSAGAEELQQLPGIGPAYAERIVAWREENGEFTSVEQLLEIRGIGERRLEQIRPLITLKDVDEDEDED